MSMLGYVKMVSHEDIKLGIELEGTFSSRYNLAYGIASFFGTDCNHAYNSHGLDDYKVVTNMGNFHVVSDSSIRSSFNSEGCEVVTPIFSHKNIDTIISLIEYLKNEGMRTNKSCGLHIHTSCNDFDNVKSFIKLIQHDFTRHDMLWLSTRGANQWCKALPEALARNAKKCSTMSELKNLWYKTCSYDMYGNFDNDFNHHYNPSRYHGLNLHSFFQKKGIEFRYFEGTLNTDKIRAYIELCQGLHMDSINSQNMKQYLYIDRPYDIGYDGSITWKNDTYLYKYVDLWLGYLDRMEISSQSKRILTENFKVD